MIDYTKIYFLNIDIDRLIRKLDFVGKISKSTGEINEEILICDYHFCKIKILNASKHNPHVIFTGSIHKLWNDLNGIEAPNKKNNNTYKGFNGNRFNFENIVEVRTHLEKLFECKASQMIIQNIEFGINTIIDFKPHHYLKGLLYHKGILFEYQQRGNFAQVFHSNYNIKIYNKSFQYKMTNNVLRIELKIKKMIELKEIELKTFSDINRTTLLNAQNLILKRFDEVVYYDYTIDKKKLTNREKVAIKNYSNPRYWIEDLKPQHRDREKKRLQKLTLNYSKNLHQIIKNELLKTV